MSVPNYAVLPMSVMEVCTNSIACPSANIILNLNRGHTDSPIPDRNSMFQPRPWIKSKKRKPNTQDSRFWFTSGKLFLPCVEFIRQESESVFKVLTLRQVEISLMLVMRVEMAHCNNTRRRLLTPSFRINRTYFR